MTPEEIKELLKDNTRFLAKCLGLEITEEQARMIDRAMQDRPRTITLHEPPKMNISGFRFHSMLIDEIVERTTE